MTTTLYASRSSLPALCLLLIVVLTGCSSPPPSIDGKDQPAATSGGDKQPEQPAASASPPKFRELHTLQTLTAEERKEAKASWTKETRIGFAELKVVLPLGLAFSPDGRYLASQVGYAQDNEFYKSWSGAKLWELPSGKAYSLWPLPLNQKRTIHGDHGIVFSPDSSRLYADSEESVAVFDVAARKHLADLAGALPRIHPNGKWILVRWSISDAYFPVALDAATGKEVSEFKFYRQGVDKGLELRFDINSPRPLDPAAVSPPDGKLLAYRCFDYGTSDHHLLIASADPAGKPFIRLTAEKDDPLGAAEQIAFTPDGKRLVGLSHPKYGPLEKDRPDALRVWQVSDGKVLVNVKVKEAGAYPNPHGYRTRAPAMALSSDGHWVALGGADGEVRLYATATGKEAIALTSSTKTIHSVAFSKDGKMLAAGAEDGTVLVWKAE